MREAVVGGSGFAPDQDAIAHGAREVVGRRPRRRARRPASAASIVSPKSAATASASRQSSPSRSRRRVITSRTPCGTCCASQPSRVPRRRRWTISPTKNGLPLVSRCSVSPSAAVSPAHAASVIQRAQCASRQPADGTAGGSTARGEPRQRGGERVVALAPRCRDTWRRRGCACRRRSAGDELEQLERGARPPSARRRARRRALRAWRRLRGSGSRCRRAESARDPTPALARREIAAKRSRSTGNTCASSAAPEPAAAATASSPA